MSDGGDKSSEGIIQRKSLSGRVVLITGASSGIGAATAVEFARHGARLSLTGRDVNNLHKVADECWQQLTTTYANSAERPLTIVADVSIEDDVKQIVDKTLERYGCLDVLVNNAGMSEISGIENTSMDQFDRVMAVNLRAVYQTMTLTVPHLIASKGNVVNVSSIAGACPNKEMLAYALAKSGIDHLTQCNALELGPKGIRVNSVDPGVIVTPIFQRTGVSDDRVKQFLDRCKTTRPLCRAGQPEEVAKAIVFLASDDASYITGQLLYVDGGVRLQQKPADR